MNEARETVPAAAFPEKVEQIIAFLPDGRHIQIKGEQLVALDIASLSVAWREGEKINRLSGVPLRVISVERSILAPV